jgi:mortality factor 4-like protein 1
MDVQSGEKSGSGEPWDYKIHYKGWKKTWDDWVGKDRIRPFDEEHKELASQLHAQAKRSMQVTAKQVTKTSKVGNESARGSEERGSAAVQGGRGGRRGKDWELEQVSRHPVFSYSFITPIATFVSVCFFLFLFAAILWISLPVLAGM